MQMHLQKHLQTTSLHLHLLLHLHLHLKPNLLLTGIMLKLQKGRFHQNGKD